jgi:hypothetical protein
VDDAQLRRGLRPDYDAVLIPLIENRVSEKDS